MRAWKAFSCSTYPKSRLERGRTAEKCTWCAGELKAYLLTPKHQSSLVRADQIGRANNLSNLHCWRHILLYSQRLSYFAFAWKWFYAEKISFSAGVPLTTFLCLQTFLAAWQIRMEGRVGKSTILHSCRISQTEKKSSEVKSTEEKVSFSVFKLGSYWNFACSFLMGHFWLIVNHCG